MKKPVIVLFFIALIIVGLSGMSEASAKEALAERAAIAEIVTRRFTVE